MTLAHTQHPDPWVRRMKTEPRPVQLREFLDNRDHPERALHWQPRSGKSKAIIDTLCYWYEADLAIDGVLIIAPNNVHANWPRRELPRHMWDGVPWSSLTWSRADSWNVQYEEEFERLLACKGLAFFSVNVQALSDPHAKKWLLKFAKKRRFAIIFDETQDFRRAASKRFPTAKALARKSRRRRGLSGTMADNSPFHLFSQYELLREGCLGFDKAKDFEAHFGEWTKKEIYVGGRKREFPHCSGYRNLEELRASQAALTSYVSREEAGLPPLLRTPEPFEMLPVQKRLYNDLVRGAIARLDGGEIITPVQGGVLLARLQQISSGFVTDEDGVVHDLMPPDENPRLQWLLQQVSELPPGGKFIVWCRFTRDIELVSAGLKAAGVINVVYKGGMQADEKQRNEDRFRDDPKTRGLVGQPLACGVGLDFSKADDIFWYSHLHGDLITRRQADERATEAGGRSVSVADLIAVGSTDEMILRDQEEKAEVTDFLVGEGLRDWLRLIP